MKRSLLLGPMLLLPVLANGQVCKRLPIDPEFPAGMTGTYEVVGREPATRAPYQGTVTVRIAKKSYLLTKNVDNKKVSGEAWIQACGPDGIKFLVVRYFYPSGTRSLGCSLGGDGNNYNTATCTTGADPSAHSGLEAWFQHH